LRFVGRVPERLAQLADGCIDAVIKLDNRVIRPELLLDFLTGDDRAVALAQHEQ
jgi:hypothetical protein